MQKSKGNRPAFEILFALLLFLLLIAILVTELSRAGDAYFYERAELVTYTKSDVLTGYIFREEIAADTLNNGPVDYLVADGAPVQRGDILADVYRDDENADKREIAAELYAQIAKLEGALATSDWKTAYVTDYTALMRELSAGHTGNALACAQSTATALGGRDAQADRDAITARIAALEAELTALTAHTNVPLSTHALKDGTFYRTADGYEPLFGINQIADLTPAALDQLLAASPKLDHVIGKLVCDGPWYLAVPLTRMLADAYTQGNAYPVHFDGGSTTMILERIHTDDTDRALLILRGDKSPAWLSTARRQTVTVEKERISGICIPADALSQDNTLFVLQDGVARLRHVTPVLREQGCLLIAADGADGLAAGERVIVSTKQLFDGKVLQ